MQHLQAMRRLCCRAFLVGDLPFGSYETSPQQAVQSAVRMMKEGLMDAVKLEGAPSATYKAYTIAQEPSQDDYAMPVPSAGSHGRSSLLSRCMGLA